MPLTPSEVSNKVFGKQIRGYAMDEVDTFLDDVEVELTRLLDENAALATRVPGSLPGAAPRGTATPETAPAPVAPGEPQEAALRTLLMAQRTADQAIAEAQAEADALLEGARSRSAQVEQEVNARTTAALAELEDRRRELEARIEDLKAFEREYRLRLKAYLESQLKDLSTRGGGVTEGPGSGVPAAARAAAVGVTPSGLTDSAAARRTPPPVTSPAPGSPSEPAAPSPGAAEPGAPEDFPQVQPPGRAGLKVPDGPLVPADGLPQLAPDPAPSGPPRETPMLSTTSVRAVPPLSTEPEPMGPFTVVPSPVQLEQTDEGPEPPTKR